MSIIVIVKYFVVKQKNKQNEKNVSYIVLKLVVPHAVFPEGYQSSSMAPGGGFLLRQEQA